MEIQDRIEKNSKKIKTLGKNLGEGIGVQDLADYTKLVNQNSFWVKVVDTYVNGKIYEGNAMEASLNILNTDFAGQIFGVDKIYNYKKELSELQSTPTFTNAAQAVQFAETGIQGLAQLGILKGKDLENAAKFMFYANAAIKVGSGIAGAMNGNPLGLVDALGAMGSLFGGKPQPSPEVQMLQEVLNQLSGIREDLARMETKIDKLNENLIKAYEALSAQIEALREETQAGFKKVTEEIKETRKILITLSDVVLKYNGCQLIDEVMQKSIDSGKLNTYSSWKKAFNDVSGISDCVQMPSMFASDISNTISICAKDAFSDHSFAKAERKAFEEARGLFLLLYDDEMAHLLSIPVSKFSNIQKLAFVEQNLPDESGLEARYIYPPALHILTERFTRYEPFRVAFYGNSFMPLDRYISKDGKTTDFDLSIEYTKNLIEATDKALRQQSVLSGNLLLHRMYSILFYSTDSKSSDESKKKIIECLNTNPVLAYNFVRYVISRDSGPTQHLMRVYNDIIALQDKNIVNENLKKIMSGSSQIYNEGQPLRATGVLTQLEHNSKKIVLKITYKADFAAMAIPNPIELSDDEMMYTDGLNMLLEVKRKLLSHLIELEMVRGMSKPDSPVSNDELKYMMLLKTDW